MPESQNIEYKSAWRDEYLKWICGFANANGGTIFIGKDDNGEVVGADNKHAFKKSFFTTLQPRHSQRIFP